MTKPDWDVFKAKFSGKTQNNFEWLCYLLFCKEVKKEEGIFRFKNQSGMETNPIKVGNDYVSWEAKFYTTEDKLSSNASEFKKKIEISKKKNPELTKLYFYTPIDWTESNSKNTRKTKKQIEVEKYAQTKKIEIIWKGASFFESPFVSDKNKIICKHFFTLDKSVFDLIEEQKEHTENILKEIQTSISFNEQTVKIDRNDDLEKIRKSKQQVLVLSGIGGIGKTALIKNLYKKIDNKTPFYLFKATEFELRNINHFFKDFNFQEFINGHKGNGEKIIVVDSAEKLLDLKNTDPSKEFLSILIKNNWKIIFTTRNHYLENLNYQFSEIYGIIPLNINLQNLSQNKLISLSEKYSFQLPKDEKLLELIKIPFYLKEYLKYYQDKDISDYKSFKDKLWAENITKNNPPRSECFQKIALTRSNKGSFFITPHCEASILEVLIKDGILGYEDDKGYFITHDIYEEWALERIINKEFYQKENNQSFFNTIGQSLPIRRSFRNWISEKLLLENEGIKNFIEEVISEDIIDQSWKNEMIVSILLSGYSKYFFENFKKLLLADKQKLLKTTTFWLRIACKEADEDFFKQLGIKRVDLSTLKYILTRPKGDGWKNIIRFVFDNLQTIGIENIYFILPIIYDWNSKFKTGTTTRFSSLIALQYYQWTIEKNVLFSRDDGVKDKLFQTILYGSSEIEKELSDIFKEIIKNKWKNHRDPYYDLSKTILTKLEGITVSQALPLYVLQLADLFWKYSPKKSSRFSHSRIDIEEYFGIESAYGDYHPVSSYQTPIYWLLQFSLRETLDFILAFTNTTVEFFAKSNFAKHEIEEIEVFIDKKTMVKQYLSDRLWCIYRNTQVAPNVLESIHMALEKFFLERGKNTKSETLEYWLLYLLKNSKSASISAVVTSIVLEFPDKTFNVAKVLFKTKSFFFCDMHRMMFDLRHKNQLLMLKNNFSINSKNDIHETERLKACDDKHRKWHLESLFLTHQTFRNKSVSEKEANRRQKILWRILDNYYSNLPKESKQTKADKTWRMFLARMDFRKMKPTTKETDKGIEIHWNPKIDPKLQKDSDKTINKNSESMKYSDLNMWSYYKMKNDDEYKKYEKYEKNPKLALKETKDIVSKLKLVKKSKSSQQEEVNNFHLFNHVIPGQVCSLLIRDYFDKFSQKEISFCKNIVLEVASLPLEKNYKHQISDGLQFTISVLPLLLDKFPKEKKKIKKILLLILFNDHPIGMAGGKLGNYSIMAIHELWKQDFEEAQSLLLGYLLLKPKYEKLRDKLRKKNYQKNIYELSENEIINYFLKNNDTDLQKVFKNQLTLKNIKSIEKLELSTLRTAFLLIPLKTNKKEHKEIVKIIISVFAEKLISNDRDNKINYMVKYNFFEKLAYFVLSTNKKDIEEYLQPFISNFNNSEMFSDLFKEFVSAEDKLATFNNFWEVWYLFKEKIIEICKDGDSRWYTERIVKSYLFSTVPWKDTATSWDTFRDENKTFFKDISKKIGHCPSSLYAISKLLNDIGSSYLNDGVIWISKMLKNNANLHTAKLEVNTIFYIENIVRKYIYQNHEKIKKTKKIKEDVLIILDFLIMKGSVIGYILRETVL